MSGRGSFVFFCAFLGFPNALLQRGGSGPMVGGGGVGPKSARVAGVGGHLSWGHWHRDTLPVLTWAIWVEEQMCPQGPGGGLALVGSQAALQEGLGVWGCPHHRKPQAKVLGRYAGSPPGESGGQGCGVHARGCRDQLEVVLCLPCPGVTGTSSFMPRVS